MRHQHDSRVSVEQDVGEVFGENDFIRQRNNFSIDFQRVGHYCYSPAKFFYQPCERIYIVLMAPQNEVNFGGEYLDKRFQYLPFLVFKPIRGRHAFGHSGLNLFIQLFLNISLGQSVKTFRVGVADYIPFFNRIPVTFQTGDGNKDVRLATFVHAVFKHFNGVC